MFIVIFFALVVLGVAAMSRRCSATNDGGLAVFGLGNAVVATVIAVILALLSVNGHRSVGTLVSTLALLACGYALGTAWVRAFASSAGVAVKEHTHAAYMIGAVVAALAGWLMGIGTLLGLIAGAACGAIATATWWRGYAGQIGTLRRYVQPVSMVLGVSPSVLETEAGFNYDKPSGSLVVFNPPASAIARIHSGALDDAVMASALPGFRIAEASAARIVFSPVDGATLAQRDAVASSGGLITGMDAPAAPVNAPRVPSSIEEW